MKNKSILVWLLASFTMAGNIQAQEEVDSSYLEIPTRGRGFQITVEGGKMNFTNTEKNYSYNGGHFYGVVGYKINPKLSAGFGLGVDFAGMSYQEGIRSLKLNNTTGEIERETSYISEDLGVFKLFARGQYRLTDNRFSPFVECNLGMRITSGLQNIYGESWIFDEDEGKLSNREEYIAGSLTQLLGKPSIVNVFATPTIGLSLRTTNNSYLELKAGYTLSPHAMGVRKSTDYTFNNEQITHIASCRPIKMSAPFVSLAFTHTFRYGSDLDESLYDATRARKREQRQQRLEKALVITGAVLGTAAVVAGTVSAVQNNGEAVVPASNSSGEKSGSSKKSTKAKNKEKDTMSVADLRNDQQDDRTYQNLIGRLIEMKTRPERYKEFTKDRISIQRQMKELRERVNGRRGKTVIRKSPWEDWDGDLDFRP